MPQLKLTEYGLAVKHRLIDLGMTQRQLERKVTEKTGLYCDASNLGKIFKGQIKSKRIIAAVNEILGMEKEEDT